MDAQGRHCWLTTAETTLARVPAWAKNNQIDSNRLPYPCRCLPDCLLARSSFGRSSSPSSPWATHLASQAFAILPSRACGLPVSLARRVTAARACDRPCAVGQQTQRRLGGVDARAPPVRLHHLPSCGQASMWFVWALERPTNVAVVDRLWFAIYLRYTFTREREMKMGIYATRSGLSPHSEERHNREDKGGILRLS